MHRFGTSVKLDYFAITNAVYIALVNATLGSQSRPSWPGGNSDANFELSYIWTSCAL